jgi:hypothetical protein
MSVGTTAKGGRKRAVVSLVSDSGLIERTKLSVKKSAFVLSKTAAWLAVSSALMFSFA